MRIGTKISDMNKIRNPKFTKSLKLATGKIKTSKNIENESEKEEEEIRLDFNKDI
jgi:hypothetical protein